MVGGRLSQVSTGNQRWTHDCPSCNDPIGEKHLLGKPMDRRQGIYWIASYPRSGNTWVRSFLAAFEEIRDGREPSGSYIGEYDRRLFKSGLGRQALSERSREQERVASRPGISFVKTHSARITIEGIPFINPLATAGAIYVVRDPRDVAISFATMFKTSVDEAIAIMGDAGRIQPGSEPILSWSENVRSWRTSKNTLVQRYEDIHGEPIKYLSGILKHIGINANIIQVSKAVAASSIEVMQARERSRGPHLSVKQTPLNWLVRSGKLGQWKMLLKPQQAARLESDHGGEMEALGYL